MNLQVKAFRVAFLNFEEILSLIPFTILYEPATVTVSANPRTHVTRGQYIPKVVIGRLLQIGQTAQRLETV